MHPARNASTFKNALRYSFLTINARKTPVIIAPILATASFGLRKNRKENEIPYTRLRQAGCTDCLSPPVNQENARYSDNDMNGSIHSSHWLPSTMKSARGISVRTVSQKDVLLSVNSETVFHIRKSEAHMDRT